MVRVEIKPEQLEICGKVKVFGVWTGTTGESLLDEELQLLDEKTLPDMMPKMKAIVYNLSLEDSGVLKAYDCSEKVFQRGVDLYKKILGGETILW